MKCANCNAPIIGIFIIEEGNPYCSVLCADAHVAQKLEDIYGEDIEMDLAFVQVTLEGSHGL